MNGYELAPGSAPSWSGENWYMAPAVVPHVMVIEPKSESYDEYHERQKRQEGVPRRSFGFARVLDEPAVEEPEQEPVAPSPRAGVDEVEFLTGRDGSPFWRRVVGASGRQ